MPELVVSPFSETGVYWQIQDLPYLWYRGNYIRAELQSQAGGLLDTIPYDDVPVSGTGFNTSTKTFVSSSAFTPGRRYVANGYVVTPAGNYHHSGLTSYIMPINAPTGLSSTGKTHNTISLKWNAKTGAVNYTVRYKRSVDSAYTTTIAAGTSIALTGLSANTTYNIAIRAHGEYASSSYSSTINVTTNNIPLTKFWWIGAKTPGTPFNVTGPEWLDLYDKVDAVLIRVFGGTYGFNRTYSYYTKGQPFYAWMFTDVAKAIRMFDTSVPVSYTNFTKDDVIYGAYLLNIQTALNNKIDQLNS